MNGEGGKYSWLKERNMFKALTIWNKIRHSCISRSFLILLSCISQSLFPCGRKEKWKKSEPVGTSTTPSPISVSSTFPDLFSSWRKNVIIQKRIVRHFKVTCTYHSHTNEPSLVLYSFWWTFHSKNTNTCTNKVSRIIKSMETGEPYLVVSLMPRPICNYV